MQQDLTYAQALAERVVTFVNSPLSEEVIDKFKMCLLDFMAACFSAHASKVAEIAASVAPAYGPGPCLMLGTCRDASLMGAAFHNALIATSEDLDDIHPYASGLHLGATTFPAIFALAGGLEKSLSGREFINATIAGYEVSSRVVRASHIGIRKRGLHSSGAAGAFGSCAAAAVALGFSAAQLANALSIAASASGGLFAFLKEGASVRHAHAAWAGLNGLSAALMGQAGMTGPKKAIEGYSDAGEDGWFAAFAGEWDPQFIMAPAEHPELLNAAHKLHAACGHAAPAITALQMLKEKLTENLNEIKSISITGYKASAALSNPAPATTAQAKFSLPFLTGLVLLFGQATLREVTDENLRNSAVRSIASKVSVRESPEMTAAFPAMRKGKVEIVFNDGTILTQSVDAPLGMPDNPVQLPVLEQKFVNAATGILTASQIEDTLDLVRGFPSLPSAASLLSVLRVR